MFDSLKLFEVSITILASFLTFINYFISLKLRNIESKIKDFEKFKDKTEDNFKLLHRISGQLDFLIKNKNV